MKIKKYLKKEWIFLLFLLIPFLLIAVFWNKFPAEITLKWSNSKGDLQSISKEIILFLIPVLNIIFYGLFYLMPRVYPKKKSYKLFKKSYRNLRLVMLFVLVILFLFIFYSGLSR